MNDPGLKTLLIPVTWKLTEPEEGVFDFSVPDALIEQVRKWNRKNIFLRFSFWKGIEAVSD